MFIRYIRPRLHSELGVMVLEYPALTWSRSEAWEHADPRGGYRKWHTAWADDDPSGTWAWRVEPDLKQQNYLRALAKRPAGTDP